MVSARPRTDTAATQAEVAAGGRPGGAAQGKAKRKGQNQGQPKDRDKNKDKDRHRDPQPARQAEPRPAKKPQDGHKHKGKGKSVDVSSSPDTAAGRDDKALVVSLPKPVRKALTHAASEHGTTPERLVALVISEWLDH